jgi:hypothetical protein
MVKVVKEKKKFKRGDKIITLYGDTETVMCVNGFMVSTYESAARNAWYHPSKIFKAKKEGK